MLCDVHSHILPGIDDGCKSTAEAVEQLKRCTRQGVERVFATPHYYHRESVNEFVEKRERAWAALQDAMAKEKGLFPEIKLGAEVAFFRGISQTENIRRLCLGQSDYLLLEMPFCYWTMPVFAELNSLMAMDGLNIVIAHVERYLPMQNKKSLQALWDTGAMVQMNAEFILSSRWRAKKLIRGGTVDVLGSDCHNLSSRVQNLGDACRRLEKMGLQEELFTLMANANRIFDGK